MFGVIISSFIMNAFVVLALVALAGKALADKPNVVYFIADDLGWADVGYMDSDVITPNIDALAAEGTILKEAYANPVCTPSRSAFMTGIYGYKSKVQHLVITDE